MKHENTLEITETWEILFLGNGSFMSQLSRKLEELKLDRCACYLTGEYCHN